MRSLSRVVLVLFSLGLVVALGFGAYIFVQYQSLKVDTVGKVDFDRRLAIPPLAESTVDARGRRVFDLDIQEGTADLGFGDRTRTWGINGDYLGPTLRAKRGEEVLINTHNSLDEQTSLHWHGMHLPAKMDGGPHQPIAAGKTWSPTWRVDQQASTLWYHPHLHGSTAEHVYKGLAGMFILDDEPAASKGLPHTYGVDDIPLIVQDKKFDDGQLDDSHSFLVNLGVLGDSILVNGTPGPYLDVTSELVRLRVLNASNARTFNFQLDDHSTFTLVGTDGGLLPKAVALTALQVAPGERAEILLRMTPGETRVLRSEKLDGSNNGFAGANARFDVLQLRAADQLSESETVATTLNTAPRMAEGDAVKVRQFDLAGTTINGNPMDMKRIDETVEVDTTEIWEVTNKDSNHHTFHVHDVQFQVLEIDGREPPPELSGWKDTVWLPDTSTTRIIMRFEDYRDASTPYMFHCHMLRHEDKGMMGQFVVVSPGESANEVTRHDHP